MLEKAIKFEHMLVYNMQGLKKKIGSKTQKNTIPLCRGSVLALGKGALCREPAWQRSAKVILCREPNGVAIGKDDDNGSRPLCASFAESLSLPRSSSRQIFPLPKALLCRELSYRQRIFAEGPFWL
jgi:hypothetical protein